MFHPRGPESLGEEDGLEVRDVLARARGLRYSAPLGVRAGPSGPRELVLKEQYQTAGHSRLYLASWNGGPRCESGG